MHLIVHAKQLGLALAGTHWQRATELHPPAVLNCDRLGVLRDFGQPVVEMHRRQPLRPVRERIIQSDQTGLHHLASHVRRQPRRPSDAKEMACRWIRQGCSSLWSCPQPCRQRWDGRPRHAAGHSVGFVLWDHRDDVTLSNLFGRAAGAPAVLCRPERHQELCVVLVNKGEVLGVLLLRCLRLVVHRHPAQPLHPAPGGGETAVKSQGKAVKSQGKAVKSQGKAVKSQGKAVKSQGKAVKGVFCVRISERTVADEPSRPQNKVGRQLGSGAGTGAPL